MRNIIYPLSALAIMSALAISPNASESPVKQEKFSGVYAGLSLDYKQSSDNVKKRIIGTHPALKQAIGQKTQGKLSAKSVGGSFDLGFGNQWNCSYLGLDLGASLYNLADQVKINKGSRYDFLTTQTRLRSKYAAKAAFRYGYVFGRVMPYITAGAAFSEWKIKTNYPFLAPLGSLGIKQIHHKKKRAAGLLAGFGVDFKYNRNVVYGGSITYRQFKAIDYKHLNLEKTKITPSDLSVSLKASYLF